MTLEQIQEVYDAAILEYCNRKFEQHRQPVCYAIKEAGWHGFGAVQNAIRKELGFDPIDHNTLL